MKQPTRRTFVRAGHIWRPLGMLMGLYGALLIGTLVLLLGQPVRAVDDTRVSLGISPAISEITVGRGQSLQRALTIDNKTAAPIIAKVYAENFEASDPYGAVSFNTDDTKQYSSRAWLSFSKPSLILAPGERQTLTVTISCPPDAEPGGHYSAVFFEPIAATFPKPNSNLGISQRVGALMFITVGGNNTEQGQVLGAQTGGCTGLKCSFKTNPFREWGAVPFTFSFQNTGNVHVKAGGVIKITNLFGRQSGEVIVDEKTVLPSSSRSFTATWPREVLFGRYTAKLTLTYGQLRQTTETAVISFWVIPWRTMLVIMSAILILIALIWYFARRKRSSRDST